LRFIEGCEHSLLDLLDLLDLLELDFDFELRCDFDDLWCDFEDLPDLLDLEREREPEADESPPPDGTHLGTPSTIWQLSPMMQSKLHTGAGAGAGASATHLATPFWISQWYPMMHSMLHTAAPVTGAAGAALGASGVGGRATTGTATGAAAFRGRGGMPLGLRSGSQIG
jgi:hypothetical protein